MSVTMHEPRESKLGVVSMSLPEALLAHCYQASFNAEQSPFRKDQLAQAKRLTQSVLCALEQACKELRAAEQRGDSPRQYNIDFVDAALAAMQSYIEQLAIVGRAQTGELVRLVREFFVRLEAATNACQIVCSMNVLPEAEGLVHHQLAAKTILQWLNGTWQSESLRYGHDC